jgi:hypothetical protein
MHYIPDYLLQNLKIQFSLSERVRIVLFGRTNSVVISILCVISGRGHLLDPSLHMQLVNSVQMCCRWPDRRSYDNGG